MPFHRLGVHKVLSQVPLVGKTLNYSFALGVKNAVNTADLRLVAKSRAHKMAFGYLDAGSDDEISLRRGKDAYSELGMHFHVLSGLQHLTRRQYPERLGFGYTRKPINTWRAS
jgi:hypothetical protein